MNRKLSSVVAEQQLDELGGIPIDRMTWRVIGKGEHYEPTKRVTCLLFDCQPPMRGQRRGRGDKRPEYMVGRKVGRMTVVGYWGPKVDSLGNCKGGAENQVWVCRCPCGIYVTRTGLTIKKQRDPDDKCEFCRHLAFLKRREEFMRLGYNPDERSRGDSQS